MRSFRHRINKLLKNKRKNIKLLDCDRDFLIKWFEFNFELDSHLNMNLDNHNDLWHIDHVIPCAYFNMDDEDQQKKCFHWSNTSPLLKIDNLKKCHKIIYHHVLRQNLRLYLFCKANKLTMCQINTLEPLQPPQYRNILDEQQE
jgi:hypothetical protein